MNDLRIENWSIKLRTVNNKTYHRLEGNIYNHPSYPHILNGKPGYTSKLMMIDFMNNKAQTENNLYTLGERNDKI